MIRLLAFLLLLPLSSVLGQDYELVWEDNFDGDAVDLSKWRFQTGNGCNLGICGWGNNELQSYQESNSSVANGMLTITAERNSGGSPEYTSSRLRTRGLGDWKYGRVEMRAKLPFGQGVWPAFWMLPTDEVYGGWAASGEIDIMEFVGKDPNIIYGTIHYGGAWPNNQNSGSTYTLPSGTPSDDFHVYSIEWEEGIIRWFVDGTLYGTRNSWNTSGHSFPAPFDQKFHLLINFAVGGNFPGNPDASTSFPQQYVIDYVRVFQKPVSTNTENEIPPGKGFLRNYPNPFRDKTTIEYAIADPSHVKIEILDLFGRSVKVLVDESQHAGSHSKQLAVGDLPTGTYLVELLTENYRLGDLIQITK